MVALFSPQIQNSRCPRSVPEELHKDLVTLGVFLVSVSTPGLLGQGLEHPGVTGGVQWQEVEFEIPSSPTPV